MGRHEKSAVSVISYFVMEGYSGEMTNVVHL